MITHNAEFKSSVGSTYNVILEEDVRMPKTPGYSISVKCGKKCLLTKVTYEKKKAFEVWLDECHKLNNELDTQPEFEHLMQ